MQKRSYKNGAGQGKTDPCGNGWALEVFRISKIRTRIYASVYVPIMYVGVCVSAYLCLYSLVVPTESPKKQRYPGSSNEHA